MAMNETQTRIFHTAVSAIAAELANRSRPTLYDPYGRPLAPRMDYAIARRNAQKKGTMTNWTPTRVYDDRLIADERVSINDRVSELVNNDPNAAGLVESFGVAVVGSGLTPHPAILREAVDLDKDRIREIQHRQRGIYGTWAPFADASGRTDFGGLQFVVERNMIQYGEYLAAAVMIDDDASRPYALACQLINPMRLKTPTDKLKDGRIKDGVEIDEYGRPRFYWIKKAPVGENKQIRLSDTSQNFMRLPARIGHRWKVLHGFIMRDADQVRGTSEFAPALKTFRDLSDYLDAELVSNIVTAAFSLFIELGSGSDPMNIAESLQGFQQSYTGETGKTVTTRYQTFEPGLVMYGNQGEKPHPIAANRPGTSFDPFIKIIKKSIAMSLNMPYPVAFKDVDGVNFAGFRSAMLDAWRTYMHRRNWLGGHFCQRFYTMLMEEAWLRGELDVDDFYAHMIPLTRADWRGAPKGDIEPVKAVTADSTAWKNYQKPLTEILSERNLDLRSTLEQFQEEMDLFDELGLPLDAFTKKTPQGGQNRDEE
jgi:lambda family phage portal protein